MIGAAGIPFIASADSAQAAAAVYTVSLLAMLPIIIAAVAGFALRRAAAEGRVLVWRSAVAALLVVFIGRQLPLHWMAWIVPSTLAAPLVALGRVQVIGGATRAAADAGGGLAVVRLLLATYLAGVGLTLVSTLVALLRMRGVARRARPLSGAGWSDALARSRRAAGIDRAIRVRVSDEVAVPVTWGVVRPTVVLPAASAEWTALERQIVLMHELAHVRAADWVSSLAARIACALYWCHPGVWWIGRRMREDCELACDDRVIASGVRRSDYAELLVGVAASLPPVGSMRRSMHSSPALTLTRAQGLRGRLVAILDPRHAVRPLSPVWLPVAAAVTLTLAVPISAVQLAPTREVLTTLMRDARWESRAYAVLGLAKRPDSVAVARSAAELDPSPRVRAWARYALGEGTALGPRAGAAEQPTLLDNR
jgi:beta-lactamase regulating signal transducer with metallopeptidase domain